MTRSNPDPVFARAAREELERRVRGHRAPAASSPATAAPRPSHPGSRVRFATTVGVVLMSAAVLCVFAFVRPAFAPVEGPAGPAPAGAITSSPDATPAPTPTPTSAPSLIGPTGAEVRTDDEIRAWAAPLEFGDIWIQQAVLDTHCMADKGFIYDPIFEHDADRTTYPAGLTDEQWQAYRDALYGPQTDEPYSWDTAGCHGLSVHVTGQDDAH